ncbi:MAG: alcohol dehydrogenase catalytic domain-containing protein [Nitrososphaeraceae archaeon]
MKAIQIKRYGNGDVVEINNTASVPSLSSGRILANIKAAGVNPVDWKIREGYMQQMTPLQFPSTLGMDFSGVIKQVGGENVPSDFKQDDEVYGQASVFSGGQEHLQNWLWQTKIVSHTNQKR